jgi:predicted dehydrogenase
VDGWGEVGGSGGGAIDATLEVIGVDGMASVTTYEDSLSIATRHGSTMPDVVMWPEVGGAMVGALREEMWDFFGRLRGNPDRGIASIKDALHGQEIAEAIVVSGAESRAVEIGSAR